MTLDITPEEAEVVPTYPILEALAALEVVAQVLHKMSYQPQDQLILAVAAVAAEAMKQVLMVVGVLSLSAMQAHRLEQVERS